MKKLSKIIIVTLLTLMFSASMVANAKEVSSNPTGDAPMSTQNSTVSPEEKFDEFLSNLDDKKEQRLDEAYNNWLGRQTDRQERNDLYLEIIAEFAPDLVDDYTVAFAKHDAIHVELFEKHTEIREAYYDETITLLIALKEELYAQAEAGELTWKEVRLELKAFMTERKETLKASFDAYHDAIADEVAAWEIKKAEIQVLREDLKTAIAENDIVLAAEIIAELYDYLLEHIDFDQYKLDTLNSLFPSIT